MLTREEQIKRDDKSFLIFLCVHFCLWLGASLSRLNIPMDSAEAIVWGMEWTLGTNKHPFLSGWLAEIFVFIFRNPDLAVYVLSQICILTAFVFIRKLALCFLDSSKALAATLILEGTAFYTLCAPEYNVNILSLAIIPIMMFSFYRALETEKMRWWAATGFWAGLALVTKYTNGVFLLCMGLYMLCTKDGRAHMKKAGPYVTAVITVLIFLPHLVWLYRHDFFVFDYFSVRVTPKSEQSIFDHIEFPLVFILTNIPAVLVSVLMFVFVYFKTPKTDRGAPHPEKGFLFYAGILPFFVLPVISGLFASPLKQMWGSPFFYLSGVLLFKCFPFEFGENQRRIFMRLAYAVLFAGAAAYTVTALYRPSQRTRFDGREFAAQIQDIWNRQHYSRPLSYVAGHIWYASNVSVYSENRPRVLIGGTTAAAPWIDGRDVEEKGAVFIAPNDFFYGLYKKNYPDLSLPVIKKVTVKGLSGRTSETTVYIGILPPAEKRIVRPSY